MFKLGDHLIDDSSPVYVIAEAGVNHNGNIDLAKKLIDSAKDSGANAVKFQTFQSEKLVTQTASKARYQIENTGENNSQLDMLKKLELSFSEFKELKQYCERKDIEFISTPFDEESAEFLYELGVHAFKIGSGDLTNIPLLEKIANYNKPIIISTGMANLSEIEDALEVLKDLEVAILHCTSNYPAPIEEVNLRAIQTISQAFGKVVGYSDHTEGNEISIAAVVLGAKIIEKHFTLDRNMPGPDHKASLEPDELKSLVSSIRRVELGLGDGIKRCMPSELETKRVVRKSIIAADDIEEGTILTKDHLTVKRPGTGIQPKFLSQLIGKTVKKGFKRDQVIEWNDI
ncbi:MAG: N-acetylneuraminate synthase [Bacillaceae bacterium]|nr:N-acetylneuraminate synthase [Bacillaceae bacterium]